MTGLGRLRCVGLIGVLALAFAGGALAARVEVADELARLAEVHGFEVRGLAETQGGWGRIDGGDLRRQLRSLLTDYDYVIVAAPDGAIVRVIILGEKTAWTPPLPPPSTSQAAKAEIALPTTRKGSQRAVKASLEGMRGQRLEQQLLIDTGADFLVLPRSLLGSLGIGPQGLRDQEVQTANGQVTAKVGRLPGLWLDQERVADVEAAFIDDEMLGGNALLGMSVLGRYRMTIDDERNELRLIGR
ncbi:hypothetical protein Thimo_0441 [Thioflavicoccus mobilis 8321]|uniref:Clan AA aspartic protease, TIGR02281 family n=1 Tax=Thioflavicoccus mobilis 8321 TaxID=765912 RepID=L0GVA4_9GAMM|nr:retropepsin-like aspartic protease [Thioflavicoccus mobilis]AGA89300.1 hypothetical protein Thimo_0441 [Thioflavicoccus mobilis 8321]